MASKRRSVPPAAPAIPRAGEGKRGEAGYLGYLLRQAAGAVRLRMERNLADLGITQAQFVVLTMLDAYPGASGAELARLALLTPQTVHGITTNLMRAGLIVGASSPVHGRIQTLGLTASGRELLAQSRVRVHRLEAELATGLSSSDEVIVRRWLVELSVAAETPATP